MKLKAFMADTFSVSKGAVRISTKGIIEDYRERYDTMVKDQKKIPHADTYTVTPGNRVMVHVKIPSETVEGFFYDVLLELSAEKTAVSFEECDIKIFSNSPSFVYSVAYIFAHWDPDAQKPTEKGKGMMIDTLKGKLPRDRMLIPGVEKKLGRKPIHDPPEIRNPMGLPLFDKSIYFAIFYLMDNMAFHQVMHNHRFRTAQQVFNSVAEFDKLMMERKRMENRQKERKTKKQADIEKDMRAKERGVDKINRSGLMQPERSSAMRTTMSTPKSTRSTNSMKSTRRVTNKSGE